MGCRVFRPGFRHIADRSDMTPHKKTLPSPLNPHYLRHDLRGKTFGRWSVLDIAPNFKKSTRWLCRCTCGTTKKVITHTLTSGSSVSCGCAQWDWAKSKRLRPYERLYKQLIKCAKDRDILMNISFEQFLSFTKTKECHYCGASILWNEWAGQSGTTAYYLDRRDSQRGYAMDNCDVCCTRCNRGKANVFTYEEWVKIGNFIRSWSNDGA